ncbi:hypothetical protein TSAR_001530 [Trichomalopsis sarcophagae]|uniref:SSD domain-containing protein n=1 Tax=Trichomalopsis sarcophagae TaxID=543379 RepID=A0A232FB32_9HYME|nr:hypothetical protein TSAR_001530 [Trichomalopsis sarcophagae]
MEASWYSRVLAHHPFAILIAVFVFSSTCLIVPLTTKKFPDFSDPQLGFEARGTPLAQRLTAWKNLLESSNPRGDLVDNPLEYYYYIQDINRQNKEKLSKVNQSPSAKKKTRKNHGKNKKYNDKTKTAIDKNDDKEEKNTWEELMKLKAKDRHSIGDKNNNHGGDEENEDKEEFDEQEGHFDGEADGFFCNLPSSAYSRVVISSKDPEQNLWSLEGVLAQCHIDAALRASPHFPSLCQRQLDPKQKCCRSWSPANYVALLSNRTSCLAVTEQDLLKVESILQKCSYFYRNLELTPDCAENIRCQRRVPSVCYNYNAAYHLIHYLLDIEFLVTSNNTTNMQLRSAMIILPIAASSATLDFYKDISSNNLSYKKLHVSAMQLGLKSTLFDKLLISDSFLVLLGFGFVTICIWSYTGSLIITVSTILVVIFSLGISYAFYTIILKINHFPFMNLLAVVVATGIGSDDAFIFCKIWECNKRQKSLNNNNGLTRLVHETMKHAAPSMFVTTLTTAVAFFASIVSNVTAINCFSLFSGITVIANFLLMVTWLPASVIIAERCGTNIISPANFIIRKIIRPLKLFFDKVAHSFADFLVKLVISLKWIWFILFLSLGIGSCFVVFRFPGLQLPDSPDFQLFDSSHLFEQYDLIYSKRFWFEKIEQGDGGDVLPMRFVWGVMPVDNGNYLNPESRGTLEVDDTFDVTTRESQVWLQNFCKNLRLQTFYRSTLGPLLPNCFIESLQPWMERRCEDPIDPKIDRSPCCERNTFPYDPKVLKHCAAEAIAEIHRTPSHLWNFRSQGIQTAGLKFRKENYTNVDSSINNNKSNIIQLTKVIPEIQAVIVEYDSNFAFSLSFAEMDKFYNEVENWMQNQLLTAPPGMKNGWFVSYLEFYELQRALYDGTIWAIVVSMGLALTVLVLVTLNPFVSLYAILAVGSAITITVAVLILLEWKLNVLESVAVSTAIGLATDFSLHYGVSYRASTAEHRLERVKMALEQMGGPTLMAALTTGAAGALMLPSRVLAYIQIGLFLVIIMGVSWIYATFFLCPMLAIAGPSYHFAQFRYPKIQRSLFSLNRRIADNPHEIESHQSINKKRKKPKGMASESTLSNSSTVCQFHCDSSLPPSPSAILLNVDVGQTRNNRRRPELD